MKWVTWLSWAVLILVVTVVGYTQLYGVIQTLLKPPPPSITNFDGVSRTAQKFELPVETITIGMAGDVLLHDTLNNYTDYRPSFEGVREMTNELDFLIVNLESLAAGEEFGLSGYPNFNSTETIIDGIKDLGSDLVMVSNNHTLDKRPAGLQASLANLKERNLPYVGAYTSQQDADQPRIFSLGSVTIGVVSYTYGLNGHRVPNDQPYLVNLIDVTKIQKDIRDLEEQVDITIALMHWGTEYELDANEEQRYVARIAHQAGADILFGGHPHVLQPYELLETGEQQTHVFYSLGNFFSGQTIENTNYGGIAVMTLTSDGKQVLSATPSFYPTEVTFTPGRVVVNPMTETDASRWTSHVGVPKYE
ncbi:poly-gamma-glutamate biosynthesis protein [Chryseomicrobium excrementi]|uniref:Poly-gamma-glutamate biosynthesis protein n=1 Tax=Chryseomicrobium excrementi TaxID=2041346 RepID=A0A2M9F0U1_9BACL|nr:CapA family protein [Chryseomicrobium excrementi]PJK17079.1 poly-gamma-glutamate biosynthesis protein [Chryseomicrobium excrementi]